VSHCKAAVRLRSRQAQMACTVSAAIRVGTKRPASSRARADALAQYERRVVEAAPPRTEDRRSHLALLLRGSEVQR